MAAPARRELFFLKLMDGRMYTDWWTDGRGWTDGRTWMLLSFFKRRMDVDGQDGRSCALQTKTYREPGKCPERPDVKKTLIPYP